ncbi:MAG: Mut7-C RNAse domain-containing protein [bacterium]|nr:Mut7-C RNAse domain-containing protein [bacterium]
MSKAKLNNNFGMGGMRFLADSMLGKLARWLRILGYDTLYFRQGDDRDLLELASEEDRIILTRDTRLSRKWLVPTLLIKSEQVEEQLSQVVRRFSLEMEERLFSRCPECNLLLKEIPEKDVVERVPSLVYETYHEFMTCPECDRIYWRGTHWENIRLRIAGL